MLVRRKYIIDNKNIYLFGRMHYLHPCSPSVAASTSKEMELETGGITTLSLISFSLAKKYLSAFTFYL